MRLAQRALAMHRLRHDRSLRLLDARGLALGHPAVAAYVAVLASDDHVDRVGVADVLRRTHRRGVHPRKASRAKYVLRAVAELELDLALMHEVELLLLFVEVPSAGNAGWHHDRVHPERRHAKFLADLPESRTVADCIQRADGVTVARD